MTTKTITVSFSLRFKWWVKPVMMILKLASRVGVALDAKRCGRFIGKHGADCIVR